MSLALSNAARQIQCGITPLRPEDNAVTDNTDIVHYFHLFARTTFGKPVREYHFDDLASARFFVLGFIQRHVPERNAEAIWHHISHEHKFGRGDMAKLPYGFLLNFAEIGPYPAHLDTPIT